MTQAAADLGLARRAVQQGLWEEAYELYRRVDETQLPAEELEALADCAWWLSRLDESIAVRQKAYSGYVGEGANRRAAYSAWFLSYDYLSKGEQSAASGWLQRAKRHLESEPECVEHGFLLIAEADMAHGRGDLEEVRELAERAIEVGQRLSSPDLLAMGIQALGRVLIFQGKIAEGVGLIDEAMTSVVAGELSPFFTGWIYCNVIGACLEIADFRRAGKWTEAAKTWCESIAARSPWHGLCRLYRVEVDSLRGAWEEAEAEAGRAGDELMVFGPYVAAGAFYEIGEIRRRKGDLAGAEDAFRRAHELGRDPQPGLALVRLAQGKIDAASAALQRSLADESGSRLQRAKLLAARVEVGLAAGDLEIARSTADELESIARDLESQGLHAAAATARGASQIADEDVSGALTSLRPALRVWQELGLPYEAAQVRTLIGIAARQAGDEEGARLELEAARAAFERLGAKADALRAAELVGEGERLPHGLSAREAEVLRLVAAGKSNREIGAELFISEHTVARHLSNIFTKLGVSSRAAATAFAFEHDLV